MKYLKTHIIILSILCWCCAPSESVDALTSTCEANITANASFSQVKQLYQGQLLQIQEDWVIEGYVVSSDRAGNFFSVLHFQDDPLQATEGFEIGIDLFESHLLFEPGQQIFIKLKGLYLGKTREVFKLGGTFSGFGNTTVGRLPALKIPDHIFRGCAPLASISPRRVIVEELDASLTNTLVRLEGLQFLDDDLNLTFAEPREETERVVEDCEGKQAVLLNSGFADFQNEGLPQGNGTLIAVVLQQNEEYFLAVRDLGDIDFTGDRCADPRQTSNQIFFSELADPNNDTGARFVELYNAGNQALNLEGWSLRRYTNASVEVSSVIDLTGQTIAAQSTFVISPNVQQFEQVYGLTPDLGVGTNSAADSNGDDNLELVDPFGTVIDVFGVPGEDGSGTNHEFEDGRAVRNANIVSANPIYNFEEWTIYNDTGGASTINLPQNAPMDFNPGQRNP